MILWKSYFFCDYPLKVLFIKWFGNQSTFFQRIKIFAFLLFCWLTDNLQFRCFVKLVLAKKKGGDSQQLKWESHSHLDPFRHHSRNRHCFIWISVKDDSLKLWSMNKGNDWRNAATKKFYESPWEVQSCLGLFLCSVPVLSFSFLCILNSVSWCIA